MTKRIARHLSKLALFSLLLSPLSFADSKDGLEAQLQAFSKASKAKLIEKAKAKQDAIIMVEFILTLSMKVGANTPQPRDQKITANGVVIREDGLILCSSTSADPSTTMANQLRRRARGQEVSVNAKVKDIKVILNDSTELEAEIVLKDEDLDITLIRPKKKPETPLVYVTLDAKTDLGLLDSVLVFGRMGIEAGRTLILSPGAVRGIIEKPRKYYVLPPGSLGLPAFDKDGKCFGVYLTRRNANGIGVGNQFVLPAADILDMVEQL